MNKPILQFCSLVDLAAFLESAELKNFEINYNSLTLSAALENEMIEKAIHVFHATVLRQEVLG